MSRKQREDLTPEMRDKIAQDYQQGAKTSVIQTEYKISPGELYRILHHLGLMLRRPAPSQPLCHKPLRPKCHNCGRDFDAGLTKKGKPDPREKRCWVCAGWAADGRGNREVYNPDGSKGTRDPR